MRGGALGLGTGWSTSFLDPIILYIRAECQHPKIENLEEKLAVKARSMLPRYDG